MQDPSVCEKTQTRARTSAKRSFTYFIIGYRVEELVYLKTVFSALVFVYSCTWVKKKKALTVQPACYHSTKKTRFLTGKGHIHVRCKKKWKETSQHCDTGLWILVLKPQVDVFQPSPSDGPTRETEDAALWRFTNHKVGLLYRIPCTVILFTPHGKKTD